jgi:cytochrome c-type biogenesis protein CcmF
VWGNHEGIDAAVDPDPRAVQRPRRAVRAQPAGDTLRANVLGGSGLDLGGLPDLHPDDLEPFIRLDPAPLEGKRPQPVLQDIGLAIHPPLLYLGYVGFSICFSFAGAALLEGRIDAAWARWVRPWTLAAWSFLTLGIAMGSYWAYYELGWGGWWFWDPVENASFMPWLAGTALLAFGAGDGEA